MNRRERRAARGSQTNSKKSGGDTPAALYEAGLRHLRAEAYLDAQLCCQQALAADADHADTLHLMGLLSFQAKQYDHAVEWVTRALRQVPKVEYLVTLGTTLQNQGRLEQALEAFDKAVQLRPDAVMLWNNRGNVLLALERPADALQCFQQILTLDPHHWESINKIALLLHHLGRFEEALKYFDLCNQRRPDHALTLQLRGHSLRSLKRFEAALLDTQRSYELNPSDVETCNSMGDILAQWPDRQEEALQWFDRALELRPDFILALVNKAHVLRQLHRFEEAAAIYNRLKSLAPDNAEANMGFGHLQLLLGNFGPGWEGYEARRRIAWFSAAYPKFSQPIWTGAEAIEGKTIVVHVDEGLGDTIQFARYVPMLAARGARVILVVEGAVFTLLSGLPGVSQCLPFPADPLPAFDFHCPMSSLPLAFGTRLDTIPSEVPYLPLPAASRLQAWEERLGPHDRLRVGLVWSGNPKHRNDRNRSIPLRALFRILDADATFVSLQKDPRPDDQAALLERTGIIDLTTDLTDFAETAALIACLDLVITVDTSVAHLAAAFGRPTWILLPYLPDWRWLLDRDDSPWYPTVRLFRQTETHDYEPVLDRVRSELLALAAQHQEKSRARTPAALYEAGLRHLQAGQYPDARTCCEQALAADANHADTLHLMGLLAREAGEFDQAVEWMARAIRRAPKPEYLASLGRTLQQQGRLEEAFKVFERAVQLKPDDAGLWTAFGNVLADLKHPADALLGFQHALKLDPRHWQAANDCGIVLHGLGRLEEAVSYFDLCDALQPDYFPTLHMRAICLCGVKGFDDALADIERARQLDPTNVDICNNAGLVLQSAGRDEEALQWFEEALRLDPDLAGTLHNKAVSLARTPRFREAFAVYDRLRAADPNDALADWGLAHLHMLTGNFEAGWVAREARWRVPSLSISYPKFPQPMWLGQEPLDGKTILIGADEGLGDTIQFARYVPMLAERGARVILVVQDSLHRLLSDLPGVSQCIPNSASATLPAFDFHCPIMSLPLAFGTRLDSIPAPGSYLPPLPQARIRAWKERLGPHDRLRVGLVWSGNPKFRNDRHRPIPLRMFSRILDVDATFVSLQKEPRPDDRAALLERTDIIDVSADLTDFVETATLIACLDLVITVDTSVAHLAGALGCPTWILLSYLPDWRWLLDRDDSPWYPTARLFRQAEMGDYGTVLDRVRSELLALISAG